MEWSRLGTTCLLLNVNKLLRCSSAGSNSPSGTLTRPAQTFNSVLRCSAAALPQAFCSSLVSFQQSTFSRAFCTVLRQVFCNSTLQAFCSSGSLRASELCFLTSFQQLCLTMLCSLSSSLWAALFFDPEMSFSRPRDWSILFSAAACLFFDLQLFFSPAMRPRKRAQSFFQPLCIILSSLFLGPETSCSEPRIFFRTPRHLFLDLRCFFLPERRTHKAR